MKEKKILLVEDDKFISRAYSDGLTRAGFIVAHAESGRDALSLATKNKPDLILLDVILPEKNGFEVLEELKMNKDLKNIPVIIMSNLGQEKDKARGKELGAIEYIVKSDYSMQAVINLIKLHLK